MNANGCMFRSNATPGGSFSEGAISGVRAAAPIADISGFLFRVPPPVRFGHGNDS